MPSEGTKKSTPFGGEFNAPAVCTIFQYCCAQLSCQGTMETMVAKYTPKTLFVTVVCCIIDNTENESVTFEKLRYWKSLR